MVTLSHSAPLVRICLSNESAIGKLISRHLTAPTTLLPTDLCLHSSREVSSTLPVTTNQLSNNRTQIRIEIVGSCSSTTLQESTIFVSISCPMLGTVQRDTKHNNTIISFIFEQVDEENRKSSKGEDMGVLRIVRRTASLKPSQRVLFECQEGVATAELEQDCWSISTAWCSLVHYSRSTRSRLWLGSDTTRWRLDLRSTSTENTQDTKEK